MPTQLIKDNVFKYSHNNKQISLYCCEAFTLFQNSIRKIRQVYLTDHAIYIISRKKLKLRVELTTISKMYVGILAGEFFLITAKSNFIIDCPQGRAKFIQNIRHISAECKIQYVNYTTLDFLFQKHKKINNKIKLTQYDSNQKKVQLKYFTGQKLNLRQIKLKWQQKGINSAQRKVQTQKDYQLTSIMLTNTYWNIFIGKKKQKHTEYSIKIYSKKFIGMQQSLLNYIWNQRNNLINLSTKYIPSLIKAFFTKSHIFVVCEYYNGYLLEAFKNVKKSKLPNLLAQIIIAVGQLHESGVVYGSISKNGIMITHDGFVFLFNLGMSIEKDKPMSPEISLRPPQFYESQNAEFSWDWWDLAILIFELVQKKPFYDGKNNEQIQQYLKNPEQKLPQWISLQKWQKDEKLLSLFQMLIKKNKKERLGYKNDYHQILHHKYFEQWVKIHPKSQIMKKNCPPVFKKINKTNDQKGKKDLEKQYIQDDDWTQMNSYLKNYQFSKEIQQV